MGNVTDEGVQQSIARDRQRRSLSCNGVIYRIRQDNGKEGENTGEISVQWRGSLNNTGGPKITKPMINPVPELNTDTGFIA